MTYKNMVWDFSFDLGFFRKYYKPHLPSEFGFLIKWNKYLMNQVYVNGLLTNTIFTFVLKLAQFHNENCIKLY